MYPQSPESNLQLKGFDNYNQLINPSVSVAVVSGATCVIWRAVDAGKARYDGQGDNKIQSVF